MRTLYIINNRSYIFPQYVFVSLYHFASSAFFCQKAHATINVFRITQWDFSLKEAWEKFELKHEARFGVEGRKTVRLWLESTGSLARSLPRPTTKLPFTRGQWLAAVCEADAKSTPSKETSGGWHCVRYNAMQEVPSLDESKIIVNEIRKNIRPCTGWGQSNG